MNNIDTITEIPPRNTKAFAEYKAGVEWEYEQGTKIEYQPIHHAQPWREVDSPVWNWEKSNYRVAPEPPELHPIDQWRAMSPEEREGKVLEHTWGSQSRWFDISGCRPAILPGHTYRIRKLTLAERNAAVRAKWEAMEETDQASVRRDGAGKLWTWTYDGRSQQGRTEPSWVHVRFAQYGILELPEPPKPRYVPWTFETCPVGAVIRHKHTARVRAMITGSDANSAAVSQTGSHTYDALFEKFTMDDGTPCGTLEEAK